VLHPESDHIRPSEILLLVCDNHAVTNTFQRACDIALDGTYEYCNSATLEATLRRVVATVIFVHANDFPDHGIAVVQRIRVRKGMKSVPIFSFGNGLGPLDRWLLGAAGAFAVNVPFFAVDSLATVLFETQKYLSDVSYTTGHRADSVHIHITLNATQHLPIEAFLYLIAGAWADGTPSEFVLSILIDAARENLLTEPAIEALVRACERPIPVVDIDIRALPEANRWYLYAFALIIALTQADDFQSFAPALHVMGHTLDIKPRVRFLIQAMIQHIHQETGGEIQTFRWADFETSMLPELNEVLGTSHAHASYAPMLSPDDVHDGHEESITEAS
jgi:hypothetical protein